MGHMKFRQLEVLARSLEATDPLRRLLLGAIEAARQIITAGGGL